MIQNIQPVFNHPELGELVVAPIGSILNIGGVTGPFFTVGGKALIFADGTTSNGSIADISTNININLSLQQAYESSQGTGLIILKSGKDIVFEALNEKLFTFNAETGQVTISGDLLVLGSIGGPEVRFDATNINVDTSELMLISGPTLQDAITSIDSELQRLTNNTGQIQAYQHIQDIESTTWVINHGKNSRKIQITIWDPIDELLMADIVKIIDENNVVVAFSSPQLGRAVLMIF